MLFTTSAQTLSTAQQSGPRTLSVPVSGVTDLAGNGAESSIASSVAAGSKLLEASSDAPVRVDTQAPTVALRLGAVDGDTLSAGKSVLLTLTFSEAPVGLGLDDIQLSAGKGSVSDLQATANPLVYTVRYTPAANLPLQTVSLSVGNGAFADAAGNPNADAADTDVNTTNVVNVKVDTQGPSVTVSVQKVAAMQYACVCSGCLALPAEGEKVNGDVIYTFTFNEPVNGFDASKLGLAYGSKGAFSQVNDRTYELRVSPPAQAQGDDLGLSLNTQGITDLLGNAMSSSVSVPAQAFDTLPPSLRIDRNSSAETADAPVVFDLTFNEAVQGLDAKNILVQHGSQSGLTKISDTLYRLTVKPAAGYSADQVSVSAGYGVSDSAGNSRTEAATYRASTSSFAEPVLTASTAQQTYTVDRGSKVQPLAPAWTLTDSDSSQMFGATLKLNNKKDGDTLSLGAGINPAITFSYTKETGTVLLTGAASVQDYKQAIDALRFNNSLYNTDLGERSFTLTVNDGFVNSQPLNFALKVQQQDSTGTLIVAQAGQDTSVQESGVGVTGDASAGGTLSVQSPLTGAVVGFAAPTASALQGQYGKFSFNTETGRWDYQFDGVKSNYLRSGQAVQDSLRVFSDDGQDSHLIVVNIAGANEAGVSRIEFEARAKDTLASKDLLRFELGFDSDVVYKEGSVKPTVQILIGDVIKTATLSSVGGSALRFTYTVQTEDVDTDGVRIVPGSLKLGNSTLTDAQGSAIDIQIPVKVLESTAASGPMVAGSKAYDPIWTSTEWKDSYGHPFLDALLSGASWGTSPGRNTINYYLDPAWEWGARWSGDQQSMFEKLFANFESYIDVKFQRVFSMENTNLFEEYRYREQMTNSGNAGTHGLPWAGLQKAWGEHNVSAAWEKSIAHELMHGLGLNHSFSDPGFAASSFNHETAFFTLMSYNNGYHRGDVVDGLNLFLPYEPILGIGTLDIAALQSLYGANSQWKTGDDVYALGGTNGGLSSGIWDAGGNDTLTAENASSGGSLDLRDATLAAGYGGGGFVSVLYNGSDATTFAKGTKIENATGSKFNDTIRGNALDNVLKGLDGDDTIRGDEGKDTLIGGAGNDTLTGGTGADKFVWESAAQDVDQITDFSLTEKDVLDFTALFKTQSAQVLSTPGQYLSLTDVGEDKLLKVDAQGQGDFASPDLTVQLAGWASTNATLSQWLAQKTVLV